MLTRINKHRDEAGFTLIELLVVVIIIGILAAIAIPVFLNQRNSARNAGAESDARNLAIAMESAYTTDGSYPENTAELTAAGGTKSQGNHAAVSVETDGSYIISTCSAESGDVFLYDSGAGGLVDPAKAADGTLSYAGGTAPWLACPGTDPAAATTSDIGVTVRTA